MQGERSSLCLGFLAGSLIWMKFKKRNHTWQYHLVELIISAEISNQKAESACTIAQIQLK